MNAERRKAINATFADLQKLAGMVDDIKTFASSIKETLEALRDEESEFYDNMPEAIQNGDKGSAVSEAIGYIEQAIEALDEVDGFDFDASDVEGMLETAIGN
jgi:uncharacterized coiled-coil DUF342 family protein